MTNVSGSDHRPGLWRQFTELLRRAAVLAGGVFSRHPGHPGQPADLLALHRAHPVLHLDRGDGALPVHLDDHDRRHDRRARIRPTSRSMSCRNCRVAARPSPACSAALACCATAIIFVSAGIQFTRFAWNRTSELADLPLWLIHVAWPDHGLHLDRLPGPAARRRHQDHSRESTHDRRRSFAGQRGAHPVRPVLPADVHARAGRFRARPRLRADPRHRAAARHDDADAGDVQRLQFLHPAGGAVLPADRQPDECRRHHRPPHEAVAHHGRALPGQPGADQRRAVDLLCRHLGLLHRRRRQPVQDLHRGADQGRLRRCPSRSPSPPFPPCWP